MLLDDVHTGELISLSNLIAEGETISNSKRINRTVEAPGFYIRRTCFTVANVKLTPKLNVFIQ